MEQRPVTDQEDAGEQTSVMSIPTLVFVYWGVSAAWIIGSDSLVDAMRSDLSDGALVNIIKGLLFVTVTAILLLVLLRRRQAALDRERARSAELREQLTDTERMDAVGRLAGGVAHDFNNLLAVVRGHLDLARLDAVDAQTESLDMIGEAVDRAVALTSELQTVARRQNLELETVDLTEIIRHHGSVLDAMLPASVTTRIDCPEQAVLVRLDPARFQQVILNLSTNASDSMPDGGTLGFSVRTRSQTAVLTVSDTGTGMTDEQIRHCFEPFYTTKPNGKGSGLGLALSYGVVRQSGGDITLHSTIGRGTDVEVTLPLATTST